jgi:hypothetical protein
VRKSVNKGALPSMQHTPPSGGQGARKPGGAQATRSGMLAPSASRIVGPHAKSRAGSAAAVRLCIVRRDPTIGAALLWYRWAPAGMLPRQVPRFVGLYFLCEPRRCPEGHAVP